MAGTIVRSAQTELGPSTTQTLPRDFELRRHRLEVAVMASVARFDLVGGEVGRLADRGALVDEVVERGP